MPSKIKKSKKVNKKSVVSRGSRKSMGLFARFKSSSTPVKILVVVSGILFATLLGTAGYSQWKVNDLQAKAGRYATIYDSGGYKIAACQKSRNGYPTVSVIYSKPARHSAVATLISTTSNTRQVWSSSQSRTWWGNVVTVLEIPARRDGWYNAKIGSTTMQRSYGPNYVAMPYTPPCPGFE